ncbi:plasmid pRiA4b ORF-3 family protein [Halosquirtibacter laminarini]|uniref:Plasmid pRiA4b ORF-3 family protein n=1 Tax=Halosquirtibacter laminarini TaxID=3374600 RepID=A0AC61NGQ4_9BACT|nr:plasmid pRiA4b ORF-3 family protein [Prolixibacteraceae bacterium]
MLYFFRILSPDHPNFICEIQVDGTSNLFTFHKAIQSACKIEEDFCSFFTCDDQWNKHIEYTAVDMGIEGDNLFSMESTTLSDLITEKKQKLVYGYDIIQNRNLYIEVTEFWTERNLDMPVLCFMEGDILSEMISNAENALSLEEDENIHDPYYEEDEWDEDFDTEFQSIDDLDI